MQDFARCLPPTEKTKKPNIHRTKKKGKAKIKITYDVEKGSQLCEKKPISFNKNP
jgi:hypothetical protein